MKAAEEGVQEPETGGESKAVPGGVAGPNGVMINGPNGIAILAPPAKTEEDMEAARRRLSTYTPSKSGLSDLALEPLLICRYHLAFYIAT